MKPHRITLLLWIPAALLWLAPAAGSAAPAARRSAATRGTVGPGKHTRWPGPITTRRYLRIQLRYDRGRLVQRKLRLQRLRKPRRLKRIVGRFLARLYAGRKLKDVVPFNFPLLAPVENFTKTGHRIARQMEAHLRTATRVEVPFPKYIDRIEIQDVATGRRWRLDLRTVRPSTARPVPPRRATSRPAHRPR